MKILDFETAFKYPFKNGLRMFNIFWILLPIFGWLALFGYQIRLVKLWIKGNYSGLPKLYFGKDLSLGFWMFLKMIPLIAVIAIINVALGWIPVLGAILSVLISLFIIPILAINFFNKETVESSFDLDKVKFVFDNLQAYIIAVLKTIGLAIIFTVMIIILVGIPASTFTKNIFLVDFYGRYANKTTKRRVVKKRRKKRR